MIALANAARQLAGAIHGRLSGRHQDEERHRRLAKENCRKRRTGPARAQQRSRRSRWSPADSAVARSDSHLRSGDRGKDQRAGTDQAANRDCIKSRIQSSPAVEQQYKELTRGYQTALRFVQRSAEKAQESAMATRARAQQEGEQFRVLDPGELAGRAVVPEPPAFALGGFGGGLALGTGSHSCWKCATPHSDRARRGICFPVAGAGHGAGDRTAERGKSKAGERGPRKSR